MDHRKLKKSIMKPEQPYSENELEYHIYSRQLYHDHQHKDITQVHSDRILISEISTRLQELEPNNAIRLIKLLANIAADSYPAAWLLIDFLTGDPELMTQSYTAIGKAKGLTRQAIPQNTQRDIKIIEKHCNGVGQTIKELLKTCHKRTKIKII